MGITDYGGGRFQIEGKPMLFEATITSDKASVNGQEATSIEQFQALLRKCGAEKPTWEVEYSKIKHSLSISEGTATLDGKPTSDLKMLQGMLRSAGLELVNGGLMPIGIGRRLGHR